MEAHYSLPGALSAALSRLLVFRLRDRSTPGSAERCERPRFSGCLSLAAENFATVAESLAVYPLAERARQRGWKRAAVELSIRRDHLTIRSAVEQIEAL
jgi:hypothetical protein